MCLKLIEEESSGSVDKSCNEINATFLIMINQLNLISVLFSYISNSCTRYPWVINCFQLPASENDSSLHWWHNTTCVPKHIRVYHMITQYAIGIYRTGNRFRSEQENVQALFNMTGRGWIQHFLETLHIQEGWTPRRMPWKPLGSTCTFPHCH